MLVRHRATLVRECTQVANRIHAQILGVGLHLERVRLLTEKSRRWVHRIAWPRFGPEQQRLVDSHFELLDKLSGIATAKSTTWPVSCPPPGLQTIPGVGSAKR